LQSTAGGLRTTLLVGLKLLEQRWEVRVVVLVLRGLVSVHSDAISSPKK